MENNQDPASRPVKRRRKESTGCVAKWEANPLLKTWITPTNMDQEGKMPCPFCNTTIRCHKSDLLEHTKTSKHGVNYKKYVSPEMYEEFEKLLNSPVDSRAPTILQSLDTNGQKRKPQQRRSGLKREKPVRIASDTTTSQITLTVTETPVNVEEATGSGAVMDAPNMLIDSESIYANAMNPSGLEPILDQSRLPIFGSTNNMLIGGMPEHSNMNYQFVGAIQCEGVAVNDTGQSLELAPIASSNLYRMNSTINYNVIEEDQEPSLSGKARAIINDLEHHRFSTEDLCTIIKVATKRIELNGVCEMYNMRTFPNSGTSQTLTLPVPVPLPTTHTDPFFVVATTRS